MNIFIMGGGRVGSHIAHLLSEEEYDITVIERNVKDYERLDLFLNARIVLGDGTSAVLLQSLDVEEADLFIACTGNDESNLIAASAAKGLGARQVLARVEKYVYVEESVLYEGFLNVDYILSPDALVAQEIVNYIIYPGVLAAEDFAKSHIQLRKVQVTNDAPACGKTLREMLPPGSGVLVGLVEREEKTYIPNGEHTIKPGDKVTLIGKRDKMHDTLQTFQGKEPRMQHVVIMGGGSIGRRIAQSLEGKVEAVKLFELQPEKALRIAAGFKKRNIEVIQQDATSRANLKEQHIDNFDLFISTTEDDERNIIAAVVAHELKVPMSAVVVHHPDFVPLVRKLGIDMAVTPRNALANSVLKILRQQSVITSSILREGDVEVLEIALAISSPVVGKKLSELKGLLPRDVLIATVARGEDAFVPGGNDTIEKDDSLVVIAMASSITQVQRLFQGQ